MTSEEWCIELNKMALQQRPFLFITDFLQQNPLLYPLDSIDSSTVLFDFEGFGNTPDSCPPLPDSVIFFPEPPSFEKYNQAFQKVMHHLSRGDSYLLNLTMPVKVQTNLSLKTIFFHSKAKYKLWIKDQFVVFSPEPFIMTDGNFIHAFPMKGTIDEQLANAKELLLNNSKELAEHYTIVDLLRNDLSMVAAQVRVEKFRYMESVVTARGPLLQTSSHIKGKLHSDFVKKPGDLLLKLLPAGSISGAPKKKTLEVISEAEAYSRGYYTGVFGYYDGIKLKSAVMIRYIEKEKDDLIFKAGGGITVNSNAQEEYNELVRKVYLPFGSNTEQK